MTSAITGSVVTSFAADLAELLLNVESAQSDSATLTRDAARQDLLAEAQHQVDALHAAADDARNGAWVSAALATVGSACQMISAINTYDADMGASKLCALGPRTTADIAEATKSASLWAATGKVLNELAAPVKTLLGDAPAADDNARAKYFETLVDKAQWVASDASSELDKVAKLGDKVLDLLQGINQDQNSSNSALINRI
jgi:hypothetical protein